MFSALDVVASSAYLENPAGYHFEGQDPDEKILLVLRAHPITNWTWVVPAILIFFLPFILPEFLPVIGINILIIPDQYLMAFIIINYLLVLVIVFEGFLSWYFNVNILTNKKIVDLDFYSVLSKNVDLAPLNGIQEASGQVAGVLGMIFHYGPVMVQTAGAKVSIDLIDVPMPEKVADIIMDEVHKIQRK